MKSNYPKLRRLNVAGAVAALLVAALLTIPSKARAATITVNNLTDPANTYGNGFCTLREAINNADASGTDETGGDCAVGSGNDNIQFSVTGTLELRLSLPTVAFTLTIAGPTANPPAITIDGGGKVQVMQNVGTLTLQYLTIANGYNTSDGGGIYTDGQLLTVSNCVFSDNVATNANGANGGAIAGQGQVTVTNSTFSDNQAATSNASTIASGGAISTTETLNVSNSTFSGNSVYGGTSGQAIGGAMSNTESTLNVTNCTFTDNQATGGSYNVGGAITTIYGIDAIINSTFSGNQTTGSQGGGGAISEFGGMSVTNSTFSGNTATGTGGFQALAALYTTKAAWVSPTLRSPATRQSETAPTAAPSKAPKEVPSLLKAAFWRPALLTNAAA